VKILIDHRISPNILLAAKKDAKFHKKPEISTFVIYHSDF